MIIGQAVWNLSEISKVVVNNKLSDAMTLSMLEYALEHVDPENDESIAWDLVNYVSRFLLQSAKVGLLHFGNIIDCAMLGLRVVEKFTKPAIRLLESMGEAAKLLKQVANYNENKDLQFVYHELIQRIRQIGYAGPRKDPDLITTTVKTLLQGLGEPEIEERQKP
jgi:hypothetical protein